MTIEFEDAPEHLRPKCPHCKQPLDKVWMVKKGLGFLQQKQIIVCPKCETIVGYGSVRRLGG